MCYSSIRTLTTMMPSRVRHISHTQYEAAFKSHTASSKGCTLVSCQPAFEISNPFYSLGLRRTSASSPREITVMRVSWPLGCCCVYHPVTTTCIRGYPMRVNPSHPHHILQYLLESTAPGVVRSGHRSFYCDMQAETDSGS